jgi:hypothetical protein
MSAASSTARPCWMLAYDAAGHFEGDDTDALAFRLGSDLFDSEIVTSGPAVRRPSLVRDFLARRPPEGPH